MSHRAISQLVVEMFVQPRQRALQARVQVAPQRGYPLTQQLAAGLFGIGRIAIAAGKALQRRKG